MPKEDKIYENLLGGNMEDREEEEIKKPPTRPWESSENRWVRDIFKINKRPRFRARFVSPDNVARKKEEGWAVADCNDYGISQEEGQIATTVTRRGMLLMEIPEELALSRDKYIEERTSLQSKDARDRIKKDAKKIGKAVGVSVDLKNVS